MRRHATVRVATADRALSELLHPAMVAALTPAQRDHARRAATIVRDLAKALSGPEPADVLATVHPFPAHRDTPAHRV